LQLKRLFLTLAALFTLALPVFANPPTQSYHLVLTPSGKADSRFPDGNDAALLHWATIPDITVNNGSSGSVNLRSFLTEPGSPNAALTVGCTTSALPTGGFSFADPTLTYTTTTTTAVVCTATATRTGGSPVNSFQFNLVSNSAAAADTTAPMTPSIVSAICSTTTSCAVTILPLSDPCVSGASTSGLKDIRLYRNAALINTQTVSVGLSPCLVPTSIGNASSVSTSQTGANWQATLTSGDFYSTASNGVLLTPAVSLSGDLDIVTYTSSFPTTNYSFAKIGPIFAKTLDSPQQAIWGVQFPVTAGLGNGVNLEQRATAGGAATQQARVANVGPGCLWMHRTAATSTFQLYSSPDCNSWVTRQSSTMTLADPVFPGVMWGQTNAAAMTVTQRVSINNLAQYTFTDTGRSPSTTYTYTVDARDNASTPNVSTISAGVAATTQGSAPAVEAWPRLGAVVTGGSPRDYCSDPSVQWQSRMSVVITNIWNGWQATCTVRTWGQSVQAVHDQSPLSVPTRIFSYYNATQGSNSSSGVDANLNAAMNANNWWLRTTYPSGSIVPGFWSSSLNVFNLYYPGGNNDGAGRTMWQWLGRYFLDVNYCGGCSGLATSGNAAAPALAGVYADDLAHSPQVSGDFNRDGTSDSSGNQTFWPGWRVGGRRIMDEITTITPTLKKAANVGGAYSDSSIANGAEFIGYYDVVFMENLMGQQYLEYYNGFDGVVAGEINEFKLLNPNGLKQAIFNHHISAANGTDYSDATPYRAAWYGMTTAWVTNDGYYSADIAAGLNFTQYNINDRVWFDYYAINPSTGVPVSMGSATNSSLKWLGAATGAMQTVAGTGTDGIRIRFYANGFCAVNPKGNGTQGLTTAAVGGAGLYERVHGTQRQSWDDGTTFNSTLSMPARDGICMRKLYMWLMLLLLPNLWRRRRAANDDFFNARRRAA
jgi:hypothetical protein